MGVHETVTLNLSTKCETTKTARFTPTRAHCAPIEIRLKAASEACMACVANSIVLRGKRGTLVAYSLHFAWTRRVRFACVRQRARTRKGQPLDLHLKRIVSKRIINVSVLVVGEYWRARPPRAAPIIHVSCMRYSYLIPFNSRRLSYTKTVRTTDVLVSADSVVTLHYSGICTIIKIDTWSN